MQNVLTDMQAFDIVIWNIRITVLWDVTPCSSVGNTSVSEIPTAPHCLKMGAGGSSETFGIRIRHISEVRNRNI
jgi:hypothetical protein